MTRDWRVWLILGIAFVGQALLFVREPVTQDEVFSVLAAEKFATGTDPYPGWPVAYGHWQPPLYWWGIGLVGRLVGSYVAAARLVGIGCTLGTLALLLACARRMAPGREAAAAWWAGALYVSNPMTVHGALVAHIDTAILPLGMMGVTRWLLAAGAPGGAGWIVRAAGWMALLLCMKWTTPLILPAAVALAAPGPWWRRALSGAAAGALGGLAALGVWAVYCATTGAPFFFPFQHMVSISTGIRPGGWEGALRVARAGAALGAWLSPFLPALALLGIRRMPAWLGIMIWVPCAAYLVGGGQTFGFFKYHAPLVPLLALVGGTLAAGDGSGGSSRRAAVLAGAAALGWFALGDPLYGLLWQAKLAAWRGEPLFNAVRVAAGWVVVGCLLVAAGLWRRAAAPPRVAILLAAGAVAWGVALTTRQAAGGYHTVYTYGGRGLREAAAVARGAAPPGGRMLAPAELLYLAGDRTSPYDLGLLWYDDRGLAAAAADPAVRAVVYGPSVNALAQLRAIEQPAPQAVLGRWYTLRMIGDFSVWVRR